MSSSIEAVRQPMGPQARTEFGHEFAWHPALKHWFSTNGVFVQVFPPDGDRIEWWLVDSLSKRSHIFAGDDAEQRAFAVAVGFIKRTC